MSESMIERIARVLYDERMRLWALTAPASLREPPLTWEGESESFRDQLRHEARLSIEAMREPTEAMIDAGQNEVNLLDSPDPENAFLFLAVDEITGIWTEMIDAALLPHQEGEAKP